MITLKPLYQAILSQANTGRKAFIDPFDILDSTGVPSANVDGIAPLGAGLLGVGLMRRLKRA